MAKKIIGRCNLCLETKPLIDSHIIPRCFQKFVKNEENKMTVFYANEPRPRETANALWEGGLLCRECDNSFSDDEKYTYWFFDDFRNRSVAPLSEEKDAHGITYKFDRSTKKIKRCLLSILWRMSIAKRFEYRYVDLGPIESRLREGLFHDKFMDDRFFPVAIFSTRNVDDSKAMILTPPSNKVKIQHRHNYVMTYSLMLPDILILFYASHQIKIDVTNLGIKADVPLNIHELKPDEMLNVLRTHFKNVPDKTRFNNPGTD